MVGGNLIRLKIRTQYRRGFQPLIRPERFSGHKELMCKPCLLPQFRKPMALKVEPLPVPSTACPLRHPPELKRAALEVIHSPALLSNALSFQSRWQLESPGIPATHRVGGNLIRPKSKIQYRHQASKCFCSSHSSS